MINSIQEPNFGFATYAPAALPLRATGRREVYEQNRHRVYAIAFWMTDNELAAEDLMTSTFCRAFAVDNEPAAEAIDDALFAELKARMPVGTLILDCEPSDHVCAVRYNILRVDLERAVIQLPNTEKLIFILHDVEGYDHVRISRILGLTEAESKRGLHQARLCVRQFLSRNSSFAC